MTPPASLASLAAFLFLAAPGILHERLLARRRPGRATSPFIEVANVVLASLAFSASAVAALVVLRTFHPSLVVDVGAWLRQDDYLVHHYRLVAGTIVAELLLALGFVVLFNLVVAALKGERATVRAHSTWWQLFHEDRPAKTVPYVAVKLRDGSTVLGSLASYETDPDSESRDLLLGEPLSRQPKGWDESVAVEGWRRLLVPASEVVTLHVTYVNESKF